MIDRKIDEQFISTKITVTRTCVSKLIKRRPLCKDDMNLSATNHSAGKLVLPFQPHMEGSRSPFTLQRLDKRQVIDRNFYLCDLKTVFLRNLEFVHLSEKCKTTTY